MKRKEPTAAQLRAWLKQHGHQAAKVDKMKMTTANDKVKSLIELHQDKASTK